MELTGERVVVTSHSYGENVVRRGKGGGGGRPAKTCQVFSPCAQYGTEHELQPCGGGPEGTATAPSAVYRVLHGRTPGTGRPSSWPLG